MAGFHSNANSRRSNLMRKVLLENLFGALTYNWEEGAVILERFDELE